MGKELNVNLNSYVGKRITAKLNANRLVEGVLYVSSSNKH